MNASSYTGKERFSDFLRRQQTSLGKFICFMPVQSEIVEHHDFPCSSQSTNRRFVNGFAILHHFAVL